MCFHLRFKFHRIYLINSLVFNKHICPLPLVIIDSWLDWNLSLQFGTEQTRGTNVCKHGKIGINWWDNSFHQLSWTHFYMVSKQIIILSRVKHTIYARICIDMMKQLKCSCRTGNNWLCVWSLRDMNSPFSRFNCTQWAGNQWPRLEHSPVTATCSPGSNRWFTNTRNVCNRPLFPTGLRFDWIDAVAGDSVPLLLLKNQLCILTFDSLSFLFTTNFIYSLWTRNCFNFDGLKWSENKPKKISDQFCFISLIKNW